MLVDRAREHADHHNTVHVDLNYIWDRQLRVLRTDHEERADPYLDAGRGVSDEGGVRPLASRAV